METGYQGMEMYCEGMRNTIMRKVNMIVDEHKKGTTKDTMDGLC